MFHTSKQNYYIYRYQVKQLVNQENQKQTKISQVESTLSQEKQIEILMVHVKKLKLKISEQKEKEEKSSENMEKLEIEIKKNKKRNIKLNKIIKLLIKKYDISIDNSNHNNSIINENSVDNTSIGNPLMKVIKDEKSKYSDITKELYKEFDKLNIDPNNIELLTDNEIKEFLEKLSNNHIKKEKKNDIPPTPASNTNTSYILTISRYRDKIKELERKLMNQHQDSNNHIFNLKVELDNLKDEKKKILDELKESQNKVAQQVLFVLHQNYSIIYDQH